MNKFRKLFFNWFKTVKKIEEEHSKNLTKFLTTLPVVTEQSEKYEWKELEERYIVGVDPVSKDESSIHVLQICTKNGEPIITKVNPIFDFNTRYTDYTLTYEEVIKRFSNILTEEDKIKLKQNINGK